MEPRPHERGKAPIEPRQRLQTPGFNGATSSRTWKADRPLESSHCQSGFNGATSSRTWKGRKLTWFSPILRRASMEPRPHERGKMPPRVRVVSVTRSLQWSHVLTNVESMVCPFYSIHPIRASMEPRPHERGKPIAGSANAANRTASFNGATSSRTWKEAERLGVL